MSDLTQVTETITVKIKMPLPRLPPLRFRLVQAWKRDRICKYQSSCPCGHIDWTRCPNIFTRETIVIQEPYLLRRIWEAFKGAKET